MVTQLFRDPDIFRIRVPLPDSPLKNLNSYVIRLPTRSLMIDTGFNRPECRAALRAGMDALGLAPGTVDLFLTHLHADHTGLVWEIVNDGGTVYMSRVDYDYLHRTGGTPWKLMEQMLRTEGFPAEEMARQSTGNQGRLYLPKAGFPAVCLDDGDLLAPWGARCLLTPGHTQGHMCLYLPEPQILFSGDHILFDISPNIAVWGEDFASLACYLAALEGLRDLPVRHTLPAHREGAEHPGARIDALLAHHAHRLDEISAAVAAMPGSTAYEIAQHITWSMRGLEWPAFPPGQKWFAASETLAHLLWLADAGKVRRVAGACAYRYFPALSEY